MKNGTDKSIGINPETASIDEIANFVTKVVDREMTDKKGWLEQWINQTKKQRRAGA